MKKTQFLLSLLAAAVMAGCSSVKLEEPAPVATPPAAPAPAPVVKAAPAPESRVATVDLAAQATAAVSDKRVVYFDFDSYVVKDDFRNVIDAHAKRLNDFKTVRLSLEGHTDERGGREYNLALGQKRAEAVAKSLSLVGVSAGQVEAVSFGKERPAVQGSDEAAWSKNRRVELKDK
jgi:peptidoglycan-associated lipoprotein